jgi:hypothetical protein
MRARNSSGNGCRRANCAVARAAVGRTLGAGANGAVGPRERHPLRLHPILPEILMRKPTTLPGSFALGEREQMRPPCAGPEPDQATTYCFTRLPTTGVMVPAPMSWWLTSPPDRFVPIARPIGCSRCRSVFVRADWDWSSPRPMPALRTCGPGRCADGS